MRREQSQADGERTNGDGTSTVDKQICQHFALVKAVLPADDDVVSIVP